MNKKHFMLKFIAPCASFSQDMTDEERTIMKQHVMYRTKIDAQRIHTCNWPALDPKGIYGFGIIEAESSEQVNGLAANHPAAKINTNEVWPMLAIVPVK